MKIVIDIPEEIYKICKTNDFFMYNESTTIRKSIANGTPLPKGHGKLIDINPIMEYLFRPYSNEESYTNIDLERIFRNAPTIIESEMEEQ